MPRKSKKKVIEPEVLDAEPMDSSIPDIDETDIDEAEDLNKDHLPALISSRAISPSDPLARYLEEIRHYPLLNPEVQLEMATRFKKTGDISIAKALVTANLRLVVKIAMEYRSSYHNIMDLIQEGNVGLMKAVANYDPYKGTRLSYYASWWIRSYILKFLLDNFRLVKVGTTQAQKKLFYNLMREKERLESQGITAGPKLLADNLNVKEKEVQEMNLRLSSRGAEISIDKPFGDDGDESGPKAGDYLEDTSESAEEALLRQQLRVILRDHIDEFSRTLNEKERILFQERLMSEEPKTLQEIADKFHITRERSRQIEAKIIEKLRSHMKVYFQ